MAKLWHYIKSHLTAFRKGFCAGFGVWGALLYTGPVVINPVIFDILLKLLQAAALGFATGMGNSLAVDFWAGMKSQIKKYKDERRIKREQKQKRA